MEADGRAKTDLGCQVLQGCPYCRHPWQAVEKDSSQRKQVMKYILTYTAHIQKRIGWRRMNGIRFRSSMPHVDETQKGVVIIDTPAISGKLDRDDRTLMTVINSMKRDGV